MAKKHERTRARRAAIQVLYTSEITGESATSIAEGDDILTDDGLFPPYALDLVRGVDAHRSAIDERLAATSENWSLSRMPIIDRSILRLAAYEMLFVADVPISVSINEAVELAKEFGGEDDSSRFVNGVLGRIARQIEAGEEAEGEGGVREADPSKPAGDAEPASDVGSAAEAGTVVRAGSGPEAPEETQEA